MAEKNIIVDLNLQNNEIKNVSALQVDGDDVLEQAQLEALTY